MTVLAEPEPVAEYSAPNTELATEPLYHVPLGLIDPNPANPRKRFAPEQLEELAADLRARGILQSLVVRRRGERYELIAGERRYRAAQLAGLETVPCRIREYANDQAALLDMLAENLSRADLSAWEEAQAYAELVKAGMTQAEIAAQFGKSQPTVANTLKLLELPQPVQDLVAEGQLSKSKAQQVGRWAEPARAYCEWLAQQAAEQGLSEAALREGLPLWSEASQAGLIKVLYSHDLPFSVQEVCKGCPHLILARQLTNPVCGNVALFREHEAEGKRRQQEEARRKQREAEAERERLRARLEDQRQEEYSAPNTEAPTAAVVAPAAPAKKQPKLVYFEDLRWKSPAPVVKLELQKLPEGCQGKLCPCAVALPKSATDPTVVWCCDRPGHHQSLAAKATRANKKTLRREFADRIDLAVHHLQETAAPNSAMLAPIAYRRLKSSRKDALRKAFDAYGLAWPPEIFSLTFQSEEAARSQLIAALRGLPVMTLIGLCLVAGFTMDVAEAVEYQRDFCPELDEFLELSPTEAALAKRAEAIKNVFRTGDGLQLNGWLRAIGQPEILNPSSASMSDSSPDVAAEPDPNFEEWREEVTDAPLPADQCPRCGHQLAPDGRCPGCVPPPAERTDEEVQCFRCGDPLPIAPCAGEECEHLANGVTVDPRGCIATPQGAYYCRSCRPSVRICGECGCTDEAGCDGGCSWVEPERCSACTGQLHLPETEPAKPGRPAAEQGAEGMSCSQPDCLKPLTKAQHEVSIRRFGTPLCPACQKQAVASESAAGTLEEPERPEGLRGVQVGDTVSGTLLAGGSLYQCPVVRIDPEALVIRVLFGEKAIPWTEPSLASWKIVKRGAEPTCTECGLVLGSSNAGQGERVKDALLCGQCLSTNPVREKYGLELIPAEGWGAKQPKPSTLEAPAPASPASILEGLQYRVGVSLTWRDPVSFRGRTGEITGIDDEGLATIEATDLWEPQVVFCLRSEMPAKGFRVVGTGEFVEIAVAAAAKGDAAMWPMNGQLYRGTVWEPLAEHLVIDTSEPVVKRMTVERSVEGLVVMTKGGRQ